MNQENEKNIFLATTALEEFWDTNKPIVFLGDWCLRYSRQSFWKQLNWELIEGIWKDKQRFHEAYLYVNDVYERLLKQMAELLDEVHGEQHDIRYWRIIIGVWLFHYIDILYDRYMCLKEVITRYPSFDTITLSDEGFIIPQSTLEFYLLSHDDPYNLQNYSRILSAMGMKFKTKSFDVMSVKQSVNFDINTSNLKKNVKHLLISLSYLIGRKESIYLKDASFSRYATCLFYLKTGGMVKPLKDNQWYFPVVNKNMDMRSMFEKISMSSNELELILVKLLPLDVPYAFLENYQIIKQNTLPYPNKPKAIFSAVGWYFDEVFKTWAAKSAESGSSLFGLQHGGNYGIDDDMQALDHEIAITDRFYSWGWRYSDFNEKVIPMQVNKITGIRERKKYRLSKISEKKDILFAGNGIPRYLCRLQYQMGNYATKYLEDEIIFFKSLSPALRIKFRVRLFIHDYGWDCLQRFKDKFDDLFMEDWNIRFQDSLMNCKLLVCDHLSTVHAEALSLNVPTILFWDTESYIYRIEAHRYLERLHDVGILHYTPESAASKVSEVYSNVDDWWNEPERQSARIAFCEQYAKNSPNAINKWINEFNKISRTSSMIHNPD